MKTVQAWEHTVRFGHLGNAQTSRANISRVVEYFCDSYTDRKEAYHKAERFLSIYDYVGRHAAFFSRKGLLENMDHSLFSVEPALLRAVHFAFTQTHRAPHATRKSILTLARAFREFEAPA